MLRPVERSMTVSVPQRIAQTILSNSAASVWTQLSIVFGADFALLHLLHITARADPLAAKLGQAGHDVDALRRIGVRPAGVVEHDRRLARAWLEIHRAHRDAELADV